MTSEITPVTVSSALHLLLLLCLFILYFYSPAFPPPLFTNLLFSSLSLSSSCTALLLLCQYSSQFVPSLSLPLPPSLCISVFSFTLFTVLHLSPLLPLFLVLSAVSLLMPFFSHFLLSVSSAAFMDGLSKCQVVTSVIVWY